MAGSDMMSWVVLGVVVIGGLVVWKNWPSISMGLMQGGGGGGGTGGVDCTANPTDPSCGGGGGAGGGLGMGVDCSMTPNDPTCQLSASGDLLGPGTNSTSTILKDINSYYNSQCVQANGCGALDTSKLKKASLQHLYQDSFRQAGSYRRGSMAYDYYINALVKVIAQGSCTACYNALGGSVTPAGQACISEASTASYRHQGEIVKVCDMRCSSGHKTCKLGNCNGRPFSICYCNDVSEAQLSTALTNYFNRYGCTPGQGGGTGARNCVCDCATVRSKCPPGTNSCTACWFYAGTNNMPCNPNNVPSSPVSCATNPSGGSHSGGSNPGGHTFTCAASTGTCTTSGQQTCFHICDTGKQKNCVRCDTSPPLVPPPSCASVRAHVGGRGC